MGQHFRISSLLRAKLEELGLPATTVLRQAGLPPNLFDQPKIFVST